jgi:HEAT repeat protein
MTPPVHRSRRQVQSGLRLSILASCHGMFWVAVVLGMPLTMFLEALGASGLMLGLAMTAQQVAMSFQLPGGIIANRLRHLKPVWFAFALPHRLVWFALPALPFLFAGNPHAAAVATVGIVAVSAMLGNLGTPAWFGWMSALIPARESGSFWGIRQAWTMAVFLLATALSGWLLDVTATADGPWRFRGFMLVFAVAAVFGTADVLIHARVPSPQAIEPQSGNPLAALRNILRDRDFRMLTLAFGLWGISLGISGPFTVVYLKRVFDASYSQLAAMTITFSLGTIVAGFFWGKIMDTIGGRSFGSIMLLAVPLFSIPWFLLSQATYNIPWLGHTPEAVVVYVAVNFLSGAFFSGVTLCQINLITNLATAESRTITMALHFTLVGLIGATGPAIGGRLMDLLADVPIGIRLPRGIAFSFFHVQALLHIGTAMGAAWIFHKTSPAVTDVPIRQLLGNPLRTLTIIQNLITVNTPRNERARARAIERLSLGRVDTARDKLEKALNDPSALVRRQALRALGRMRAVACLPLLERYYRESGDTDLFPALAAALGDSGDAAAIPILIEMLNAPHATRIEAVRALGLIGDEWSRHPLINLLQHSEDPYTIEAVGSALARIASRQIEQKQARIAQTGKLAGENSDFAVGDLIKSLSDPSPGIQEATIDALGAMQSPAAVHALLQRLRSVEDTLKPHIAAFFDIIPRMKTTSNPLLKRTLAVAAGNLLGKSGSFYAFLIQEENLAGSQTSRSISQLSRRIHRLCSRNFKEAETPLNTTLNALEHEIEHAQWPDAARHLFELAVGLAKLTYGIGHDNEQNVFIEKLIWHNQHLGICAWFLYMTTGPWNNPAFGPPTQLDVLLGLYALAEWNP